MKYAKEVMELMRPYEKRRWRMAHIVRSISPAATGAERQRIRNGVLRVLDTLIESHQVECIAAEYRGGFATYRWVGLPEVPHALAVNCQQNCHTTPGTLRP